ncbi:carbohydrate ABC transporter substrate-binding protein [Paenibacillus ginsengarvi]|uniref:Carbohydrate ABC transporter substrate-binding protein n=1 Tax=Paenibacillus ginsengarvi TaxID=400777 RepID=A0A3B0CFB8_9BACL|nr:carbohydrate ABC transporter substrate-binding protein [Paenibacillus ginsengarvi]
MAWYNRSGGKRELKSNSPLAAAFFVLPAPRTKMAKVWPGAAKPGNRIALMIWNIRSHGDGEKGCTTLRDRIRMNGAEGMEGGRASAVTDVRRRTLQMKGNRFGSKIQKWRSTHMFKQNCSVIGLSGFAAAMILMTGCSGGKTEPSSAAPSDGATENKSSEPIELVFHTNTGGDLDSFNKNIGNRISAKFPDYKITYIQSKQGSTLADLMAQGKQVDILYQTDSYYFELADSAKLQYDMSDLVKTHGLNLSTIEQPVLDSLRKSGGGKLYALPVSNLTQVMYYNKGLFDKFGVPYPKDGMTWDETLELAKKAGPRGTRTIVFRLRRLPRSHPWQQPAVHSLRGHTDRQADIHERRLEQADRHVYRSPRARPRLPEIYYQEEKTAVPSGVYRYAANRHVRV